MAGLLEAGDDLCRESLVRLDVTFVTEEDAPRVNLYGSVDCGHWGPRADDARMGDSHLVRYVAGCGALSSFSTTIGSRM